MLAIQAQSAGGPEVLKAVQIDVPKPGPGQVLIRQEAAGLNYIDVYQRSGLYPISFPAVLGLEGAGIVEAVGSGVTRFAVGDRAAFGTGPLGAYAEMHVVAEGRVVRVPDDVGLKQAAGAMLKGMTAEFLLRRCYRVSAGDTILVHAAAGGVGSILTQWARALGANVIGTVGTEEKAALTKANGCHHTILYRTEGVAARVAEITSGKGVQVAYDSVGADTFEASLASLARRGMFVSFGNASGPVAPFAPARLAQAGSLFFTRPTLFDYVATTEDLDASAAALFAVIASGAVKIDIGAEFALADTRAAHEALESRSTTGSTLLIP